MRAPNGNGVWRSIVGVISGALIVFVGFYIALGRNVVTRAEVSEKIRSECTYIPDKALIGNCLQQNTEAIRNMQAKIDQMALNQSRMQTTLEAIQKSLEG